MQITPNFHRIGGFVNQYLIINGKDLTLIDAGLSSNAKKVLNYLIANGFDLKQVKRILVTHSDSDHYGAVNKVREATGAEVWTSQLEADAMRIGSSSRPIVPSGFFKLIMPLLGVFLSSPPTFVDRIISDGETLPILGGLQVIATPGHTPGHLSFYLPNERILIAGDSINESKGKPVPTTDATTFDSEKARETFKELMHLNPSIIACGHAFFDLRN
jgi:glyoxylase-like metal-dependent hydrolase (beta-lactamase superfamily II)